MGRPRLKRTIKRNGQSIKYYEDGEYINSISLKKLGEYLKEQKSKRPVGVSAQKEPREDCVTKVGSNPNTTYSPGWGGSRGD